MATSSRGLAICELPRRAKWPPSDPNARCDTNQLPKFILDVATGQIEDRQRTSEEQGKDPAAVALGRKGGLKGGRARAAKLTAQQRQEISRRAKHSRRKQTRRARERGFGMLR